MLGAQLEEQVGACLEAVVRAVVDDARQVRRGAEHAGEVGRAARPASVPRDSTRGITISPAAPTDCGVGGVRGGSAGLCAPVPTTTGMPASTRRSTPCRRCSSGSSGQSPIDPQYTTPDMPAAISRSAVATRASRFTRPPRRTASSAPVDSRGTRSRSREGDSKPLRVQRSNGPAPQGHADVVVIGAGIVGLCSALELAERGRSVVVLDRGPIDGGCAVGSAGHLVPSHVIPLAAPGAWPPRWTDSCAGTGRCPCAGRCRRASGVGSSASCAAAPLGRCRPPPRRSASSPA